MSTDKSIRVNELGQPIGFALPDFVAPPPPPHETIEGKFCRLEPLSVEKHAEEVYAADSLDKEGRSWTYLSYGPFPTLESYKEWLGPMSKSKDPLFFAIVDLKIGKAVGVVSYLRVFPDAASIEIGHVHFSPLLQRTTAATEAIYLLLKNAFDLGYRRLEWKCDSLNEKSCNAAVRLGHTFEGIFRQARVYNGRNRDTAWYSMIDDEWEKLKLCFLQWLDASNFDVNGTPLSSLSALTKQALAKK